LLKRALTLTAIGLLLSGNVHAQEDNSWLESYNRAAFEFNYQLDRFLLKPIAKGYRNVTNQDIRNRVSSAVYNVQEPLVSVNHTLQGSFAKSAKALGRLAINSTLGLGGMFDVAEGWGLKKETTDFDTTLATWCIPDGPFVVVPLIGLHTPRSLTGYGLEMAASPLYWATYNNASVRDKLTWGYTAVDTVVVRERNLDFLDALEQSSIDFYAASKAMFIQYRQGKNSLCASKPVEMTYDFDFDMDDDD